MNIKIIFLLFFFIPQEDYPDAEKILDNVDKNMSSDNRVYKSTMVVHGRRGSRTISLQGWSEGDTRSLTEYLSPPREAGTKMLKLDEQLWIYTPDSDRTIQISGHMLKQSVMGSDLSYEDVMESRALKEMYNATVTGEEIIEDRSTWVLTLVGKVEDISYHSRKIWIDKERSVPLKEELFAKSGTLLKKTVLSDIKKIDGRWFPTKILYRDMLKDGMGTEYIIDEIKFDQEIPEYIFSKASLKK